MICKAKDYVGAKRTYAFERRTIASCGLYEDKVAGGSGNDEVVPFEHASRIKPPDWVASGVSGVVTSAPLNCFNADVGRTLEFQSAPIVELKVSKGASKWHLAREVRKHRGCAIRPLGPSLTGDKLRCAVGNRARCSGENSIVSRPPWKKERLATEFARRMEYQESVQKRQRRGLLCESQRFNGSDMQYPKPVWISGASALAVRSVSTTPAA